MIDYKKMSKDRLINNYIHQSKLSLVMLVGYALALTGYISLREYIMVVILLIILLATLVISFNIDNRGDLDEKD